MKEVRGREVKKDGGECRNGDDREREQHTCENGDSLSLPPSLLAFPVVVGASLMSAIGTPSRKAAA